uniref:Uncharacterized protein n=1 Tax=Knipowitschia caucasica TaxID=637954 RepID=A0AAV2MQI8_KNICA
MWLNLVPQTDCCPAKCVCYAEPKPTVACQQQGLFSIPTEIPVRSQRIFLQSNKLTVVRSTSFSSCHNLSVLWLYSNNISYIDNGAFYGLEKLEELDIGDNGNLRTISPTAFRGLTKLHTLHLHSPEFIDNPESSTASNKKKKKCLKKPKSDAQCIKGRGASLQVLRILFIPTIWISLAMS